MVRVKGKAGVRTSCLPRYSYGIDRFRENVNTETEKFSMPRPAGREHDATIMMRVSAAEKRMLARAAEAEGKSLSAFLRDCAKRAATRVLRDVGQMPVLGARED